MAFALERLSHEWMIRNFRGREDLLIEHQNYDLANGVIKPNSFGVVVVVVVVVSRLALLELTRT